MTMTINPHLLSPVRPKKIRRRDVIEIKNKYVEGERFSVCKDLEVVRVSKYRYTYDDGHQRVIAAKELSMGIPVKVVRDLYEEFSYFKGRK